MQMNVLNGQDGAKVSYICINNFMYVLFRRVDTKIQSTRSDWEEPAIITRTAIWRADSVI